MRFLALLMFLLPAIAGAQEFEFKMISGGSNRPGIPIWRKDLIELQAGLHAGRAPVPGPGLDSLVREGIVRADGGRYRPTCMVVTVPEGATLDALAQDLARKALPIARRAVAGAKTRLPEMAGLRELGWDQVSFFLASDVLLDNWQINAVEKRWLQAERPLRGTARYYCAFLEGTGTDVEAFRIYGNQFTRLQDGRYLGVYGNRRGSVDDLTRKPPADLAGFAVIDTAVDRRLVEIAASFTDSLVGFLAGETPRLKQSWQRSAWGAEVTWEEWAIWWYHFFYTALTDQLAAARDITIPRTGLFHYVAVP